MLTIFSIPKPFTGLDDTHQRNAINSWKQLVSGKDIILIGDDLMESAAHELGVRCVTGVATNEQGTPLVSSAFQLAREYSTTPLLVFANCDMILFDDLAIAVERLARQREFETFFATTRRINLPVNRLVNFSDPTEVNNLKTSAATDGVVESLVCKDVMIFPRHLYQTIPDFAVGRGNWDNWMVFRAKQLGAPVVRLTTDIPTIHQAHSYSTHGAASRRGCYVTSPEACQNQILAGGRHLLTGSTCDYFLDSSGLKPNRLKWMHGEFWRDFPRFAALLLQLAGWTR